MKRIFLMAVIFAFFAGIAFAEEAVKIVARVNSEVITAKDLDEYYRVLSYKTPGLLGMDQDEVKSKENALKKLIEDRLILAEAKKKELQIPQYFVTSQLNKMIESYPSREEFENSLIERGLTVTMLKERILGQFLMRQVIDIYVSGYVSVSPQEVSQYYEEHKSQMQSPESYSIFIAQNRDKNKIVGIAKSIKEKGITAAGEEYPDSLIRLEASAGEIKDEIMQIVKSLKEGEQSVKTIEGVNYLVYLEKVIPPKALSLAQAQDSIRTAIWNKKFRQRFEEWIKQLKDKAVVKTFL